MPRPTRSALSFAVLSMVMALISSDLGATPVYLWTLHFGVQYGQASGEAVERDGNGNVIVAGRFTGFVDFGGGILGATGDDVFLAMYDPQGSHLWSESFGGSLSDQPDAIALDGLGNILVAGAFQDTASFGGSDLAADGIDDIFLAKYDANGAHIWSQRIGGPGIENVGSVAVDNSNNVIVTGYFEATVDFGGGGLTSAGGEDIFVAKYDANGTHLWSQRYGGIDDDEGKSAAVDASDNVVVCGHFQETVDFGGGSLISAGGQDIFVAKYDASGTHLWSQRFGGTHWSDEGSSVAVDASNNILATGYFNDTAVFGDDTLTSAGNSDVFLIKLDQMGSRVWSQRFGSGAGGDEGRAVTVDELGNVGVTGIFVGTVNFGGGDLSGTAGSNIFVAMYDPAGTNLWGQAAGVVSLNFGNDLCMGSGDTFATGAFEYGADFGGGFVPATGFSDAYLARYAEPATGARSMPFGGLTISAYPNPFNPWTTIRYTLPAASRVIVSIFDVRGRLVAKIVDETQSPGEHITSWDGTNSSGDATKSGVYFAQIWQDGAARSHKLILLK